ncbi:aspartyl-phosphate phosphatase Spo0E family protein [Pelotomaculum propionicicum]
MSRTELLIEIERLRSVMYTIAPYSRNIGELLEVSQQLDGLIVEYQKVAG